MFGISTLLKTRADQGGYFLDSNLPNFYTISRHELYP